MTTPLPSRGYFAIYQALMLSLLGALLAGACQAASLNIRVLNAQGQPLKNAVVTATWNGAAAAKPSTQPAVMAQKHRTFIPHVLVVPQGEAVSFPNEDTTRHEVYSFSPPKKFELKLYAGVSKSPVVFPRAGVEVLGCAIHDTMQAFIVITRAPRWGKSDARGRLQLTGLPPGTVTLHLWHPWMPAQGDWKIRKVDTTKVQQLSFHLDLTPPPPRQRPMSSLQQKFNRLQP